MTDPRTSSDADRACSPDSPVFLARGLDRLEVTRADVEIDLDLESSYDGGVYLWGSLVTDRVGAEVVDTGYRSFVTWERDLVGGELTVFEDLCNWLEETIELIATAGLSLALYCYYEETEAGALRRLARTEQVDPRWEPFIERLVTSDSWIDLLAVCRAGLVTEGSMGLKSLAPLSGFRWEDDDPGGVQSMAWHQLAVDDPDPVTRESNRDRILTYNRNDVEATLALREWLDRHSGTLRSISSLDRPGRSDEAHTPAMTHGSVMSR